MGEDRYHTKKFIEAVTNNLPSPEESGPKTDEGKAKVRWNALKHGLNVVGIMPCKGSGCFYRELCPLMQREIPFESEYCLVEYARMKEMDEYIRRVTRGDLDEELNEEFLNNYIALERADRYLALFPDIDDGLEGCPEVYLLKLKLQKKYTKLTKSLLDMIYGTDSW